VVQSTNHEAPHYVIFKSPVRTAFTAANFFILHGTQLERTRFALFKAYKTELHHRAVPWMGTTGSRSAVICLSVHPSIHPSIYGSTPFVGPWPLFQFLDLFTQSVALLGRGISPSQGRYLHIGQHKQNKRIQTSIPQVGFEHTIPVFKWTKTVHALDRAATVIRHVLRLPVGKRVTSSVVQIQSGAELQQAYDPRRKFYLLLLTNTFTQPSPHFTVWSIYAHRISCPLNFIGNCDFNYIKLILFGTLH
jgi:hypothetical protein